MKRVGVYCSSRVDLPEAVTSGARLIASVIGRCGGELVYGGVNAGLMHTVGQGARDSGAKVTGVVPEVFGHRVDPVCHETVSTRDLNERKGRMIEMADVFVVLPGGIGTIDEWISTLSHIMVQERVDPHADKPILVWNHEGMYDGQVRQLAETAGSVYARGKRVDRSLVFTDAAELAEVLGRLIGG